MRQKSRRIDNDIQKSSRWLQGYINAIQDSRHKPLVANSRNTINTTSYHEKHQDGHPRIHQEDFKIKISDIDVKSDLTASSSQEIQFWR
jgi:hypothetical protein